MFNYSDSENTQERNTERCTWFSDTPISFIKHESSNLIALFKKRIISCALFLQYKEQF